MMSAQLRWGPAASQSLGGEGITAGSCGDTGSPPEGTGAPHTRGMRASMALHGGRAQSSMSLGDARNGDGCLMSPGVAYVQGRGRYTPSDDPGLGELPPAPPGPTESDIPAPPGWPADLPAPEPLAGGAGGKATRGICESAGLGAWVGWTRLGNVQRPCAHFPAPHAAAPPARGPSDEQSLLPPPHPMTRLQAPLPRRRRPWRRLRASTALAPSSRAPGRYPDRQGAGAGGDGPSAHGPTQAEPTWGPGPESPPMRAAPTWVCAAPTEPPACTS